MEELFIGGLADLVEVIVLTLQVSGIATIISVILGLPAGLWLALSDFPGKKAVLSVVNFGMGLPPVVVGLFVSLLLWRYGPLGSLSIMYTPTAMIIAQSVIASPSIAGLSFAAIGALPSNTARSERNRRSRPSAGTQDSSWPPRRATRAVAP